MEHQMDIILLRLLRSILSKEATTDEKVQLVDDLCTEWNRVKQVHIVGQ